MESSVKRPRNSFVFFIRERKGSRRGLKLLSQEWRRMPLSEKSRFEQMARRDLQRFRRQTFAALNGQVDEWLEDGGSQDDDDDQAAAKANPTDDDAPLQRCEDRGSQDDDDDQAAANAKDKKDTPKQKAWWRFF